jgi:proline iminopeptidase
MLCTGGPGLCDYMGRVAALMDDIARVYCFDPRGCGLSSVSPPYDLTALLSDLDGLREALGWDKWIIGGHSFGADLALAYTLERSDQTQALVYLSGTGVQDDRQWKAAYEAGKGTDRDDVPETDCAVNKEVNRAANSSWRQYIKAPLLLRNLAQLQTPTIVIYGGEDIRPSWPVEQVAHLLPNARLHTIVGAGHCPWLTHATELRALIRAFLGELDACQNT